MAYGPPVVVEGRPREGLPFGLFSVLQFGESADERWINGIEWETMSCEPASGFEDPSCDTFGDAGGQIRKFFRGSGATGEARSFGVYGSYKCGAPGGAAFREGEERATAHLLAREEGQAEARVWARLQTEATDVGGAASDPAAALADLELWLGRNYGSLGVIHMTRDAALLLGETHLYRSGTHLYTTLGTPVSAGGGYPGTGPLDGSGDPQAGTWMLASPALFGRRGQVMSRRELDREKNDVYALAERQYVVGFDPCGVAAALTNIA